MTLNGDKIKRTLTTVSVYSMEDLLLCKKCPNMSTSYLSLRGKVYLTFHRDFMSNSVLMIEKFWPSVEFGKVNTYTKTVKERVYSIT